MMLHNSHCLDPGASAPLAFLPYQARSAAPHLDNGLGLRYPGAETGGPCSRAAVNGTEIRMNALARLAAAFATLALAGPALAEEPVLAVPHPWQMDLQAPASPVAERLQALNLGVSVVIVIITLFVGGLLAWVLYRYNEKRHPVPGTISHNSTLEAAWTALPVLILVGIFIPSLRLVYYEDRTHDADPL